MREFMVGLIAVGAVIGLVIGRQTERARRGMKDYQVARTAVGKGRQLAVTELLRAARYILLGALAAAILFLVIWKSGNRE